MGVSRAIDKGKGDAMGTRIVGAPGQVGRGRGSRVFVWFVVVGLVGAVGGVPRAGGGLAADEWDAVDAAMGRVSPWAGLLVAEVEDGRCETVHGYEADERLAIASTFKLYVLAELGRQIGTGEAAWDEEIAIRDELKSMPSGNTVYEAAGTQRTLEELALRMIRDSDNTATDHLIDRLGRERVEGSLETFGHGEPAVNVPLLLTRELFAMKMHAETALVEGYLGAKDGEQRRILAEEVDPMRLSPGNWGHWTGPAWIDGIEWFASPSEVCGVLAALHAMADDPELRPLRRILGGNRGGIFMASEWPFAGYKGGYEAGVVNATWLLEREDGRTFVVTAGFNDRVRYVDQGAVWGVLGEVEGVMESTRMIDRFS